MNQGFLLKFGLIGAVITALCCFTPVLIVLFAAVGLGWAVGYLDYVLFPALFIFLGIVAVSVWRTQPQPVTASPDPSISSTTHEEER